MNNQAMTAKDIEAQNKEAAQSLKVEPTTCLACGKQVWAGVAVRVEVWGEEICKILHLDFLGGTVEQDDTGAFHPSARHQYTIHEHQPGER